jgi:hypothetical protein
MQPQYENISDSELLRRLNATLGDKATELPGVIFSQETNKAVADLFTGQTVAERFQFLARNWSGDEPESRLLIKKIARDMWGTDVAAAYEPALSASGNAMSIDTLAKRVFGTKVNIEELRQMVRESSFFSQQLAGRALGSDVAKTLYRSVSQAELLAVIEGETAVANAVVGMSERAGAGIPAFAKDTTSVIEYAVPVSEVLWHPGMKWSTFQVEQEWVVRGSKLVKAMRVRYQGVWHTLAEMGKILGL